MDLARPRQRPSVTAAGEDDPTAVVNELFWRASVFMSNIHGNAGGDWTAAAGLDWIDGALGNMSADPMPAFGTRAAFNYPNPFNPTTTFSFVLERGGPVRVAVFDLRGAHVASLLDGVLGKGPQSVTWNGKSASGARVASGTYVMRVETDLGIQTHKVMLTK